MREFGLPNSRAAALPLPSRVLYTAFAALTLAGCLSCVPLYDGIVRFQARTTPQELCERLIDHYRRDGVGRQRLLETTHAPRAGGADGSLVDVALR